MKEKLVNVSLLLNHMENLSFKQLSLYLLNIFATLSLSCHFNQHTRRTFQNYRASKSRRNLCQLETLSGGCEGSEKVRSATYSTYAKISTVHAYPASPFTILEFYNPSNDVPELHKVVDLPILRP